MWVCVCVKERDRERSKYWIKKTKWKIHTIPFRFYDVFFLLSSVTRWILNTFTVSTHDVYIYVSLLNFWNKKNTQHKVYCEKNTQIHILFFLWPYIHQLWIFFYHRSTVYLLCYISRSITCSRVFFLFLYLSLSFNISFRFVSFHDITFITHE